MVINNQNEEDDILILDENDSNKLNFDDYIRYKCSDERTLLHLVCESGVYKYLNNCFNILNQNEFKQLESIKDKNNKTPIDLAKTNEFENKFEIFKFINTLDNEKNTILHRLVKENKMTALRLLLEYASNIGFIDTIGFGLKNNENKTPVELAIDLKNSEAIYLLNHYELNDKSLNLNKYPKMIEEHFIQHKAKIEVILNFNEDQTNENKIRNLIFQGGGIKGIANIKLIKLIN